MAEHLERQASNREAPSSTLTLMTRICSHGIPEFKSSATLVKQATGSPPTSWQLLYLFMLVFEFFFITCIPGKPHKGIALLFIFTIILL